MGSPSQLPNDPDELKALLQQQQRIIDQQRQKLDRNQKQVDRFREKVTRKQDKIEHLEERLRRLLAHRFGRRSEKNPDQFLLFNEAELLDALAEVSADDEITVPAHKRTHRKTSHALPPELPRVEVVYELDASEQHCSCGKELKRIG